MISFLPTNCVVVLDRCDYNSGKLSNSLKFTKFCSICGCNASSSISINPTLDNSIMTPEQFKLFNQLVIKSNSVLKQQ